MFPADHFIANEQAFLVAVERCARGGQARVDLTTIGIVPTRAETGYGYIEVAEPLAPGLFRAARFVEKPDRARREVYLAGKKHWWNAGMFFFQRRLMLDAVAAHLPAVAAFLGRADVAAKEGGRTRRRSWSSGRSRRSPSTTG